MRDRFPSMTSSLLLLFLLTIASPAAAQTVTDLRRENALLRDRVDQLEAELEASRALVADLRDQVEALANEVRSLRDELRRRPLPAPTGAPPASGEMMPTRTFAEVPEDDPFAAPEAMLLSLIEDHENRFEGVPYDSREELVAYLRDLRQWIRSVRRTMRNRVEWLVRIDTRTVEERGMLIEYQVIDPESGLAYSDRLHTLVLPLRYARRVEALPSQALWTLEAAVVGDPELNPAREERGFFDFPAFIGPFVEFGFELSVQSLLPVVDEEDAEAPDASAEDPDVPPADAPAR